MPVSMSQLDKLFKPRPVPEALLKLLEFQERVGWGSYSQAISLDVDEKLGLIHGWSKDEEFLGALYPFAQANGSGSFYALWNHGEHNDPLAWPVVVFGDEGGEWVVAQNLMELLAMSTCDEEPMIDYGEVMFFRDEETSWSSQSIEEYIVWLRETFGIVPIEDPNAHVAAAQALLQDEFENWKAPFLAHKNAA